MGRYVMLTCVCVCGGRSIVSALVGDVESESEYLNLNSLLVKRQIDNPSPGAVTGEN